MEETKYKLSNIEMLNPNENICKLDNKRLVQPVKMKYRRKSRSGLTIYNVDMIEDTDIYLMVKKSLNIYHYNPKVYDTKGVIITTRKDCNELLEEENKTENIDYVILDNEEIEKLKELINKIRSTFSISKIVENYNKIKQYIQGRADKVCSLDEKYFIKKTLYRLVERNIMYEGGVEKRNSYYVTSTRYIHCHIEEFNKLFYIKVDENYSEFYYRKDDTIAGYIVDGLVFSSNRMETKIDSSYIENSNDDDEYIEVDL